MSESGQVKPRKTCGPPPKHTSHLEFQKASGERGNTGGNQHLRRMHDFTVLSRDVKPPGYLLGASDFAPVKIGHRLLLEPKVQSSLEANQYEASAEISPTATLTRGDDGSNL